MLTQDLSSNLRCAKDIHLSEIHLSGLQIRPKEIHLSGQQIRPKDIHLSGLQIRPIHLFAADRTLILFRITRFSVCYLPEEHNQEKEVQCVGCVI